MYISCVSLNMCTAKKICWQQQVCTAWLPKDSPLTSKAHQSDFRHYQSCAKDVGWDKSRNKSNCSQSDCQSRVLVAVHKVNWSAKRRLWGHELKERCSAWSLLQSSFLSASHQRLSLSSADLVSLMRSDKVSGSSWDKEERMGQSQLLLWIVIRYVWLQSVHEYTYVAMLWLHDCPALLSVLLYKCSVVAWLSSPAKSATLQVQCGCMNMLQ